MLLVPATHMPGVGEVLALLLFVSAVVGLPAAGIVVLIVGLVSRSRGRPRSAGYLVKLGLIVFAAFPVTVLLFFLLMVIVYG